MDFPFSIHISYSYFIFIF